MGQLGSWFRSLGARTRAALIVFKNKFPVQNILAFNDNNSLGETSSEIISLVFVDVAGFSAVADHLTPAQTYETIMPIMNLIIKTVEKHNGIVDKTMGDGVFAYFKDTNGRFAEISHADRAILCAIEIQREMMKLALAMSEDSPMLPLRVGVNTASVCIGPLGQRNYWEYAIYGRGVNFAQRLEQACDIFSVMASESTVELATSFTPFSVGISRKIIKPKHQTEVITVFEIDPFSDKPLLREKAIEKFRVSRRLQRREERINIPSEIAIQFSCDFGEVKVVDFSLGGLSVSLEKYLAKNVDFIIPIVPQSGILSEELLSRGIDRLWLKVKWGKVENQNFIHGAEFLNLSDTQREFIFRCLEDHVFNDTQHKYVS